MTQPLFSVVIPTYNRAELVQQAAASALTQTLDDVEVVVSDNLSTDETREAVEKLGDARVRYVRPPEHMVLPDHWEFARTHASGRYLMMLSDDDALLPSTLEHFAQNIGDEDGSFLFCRQAEYRDRAFPPPAANGLEVPAFTGRTSTVDPALFVGRLLAFRPKYNMHPSGFVFASSLADAIAARNSGRMFQTLGVEYFAWPIAAVLAQRIVHIDLPLVIIGRTAKSWGTNMVLLNPGEQKVERLVADAQTQRRHTPLTNFTLSNLILEGLLTAKATFPEELDAYEVDMAAFVEATRSELDSRRDQGRDVSREVAELDEYIARNPSLARAHVHAGPTPIQRARRAPRRLLARLRGDEKTDRAAFHLEGDRQGFHDALSASVVLSRLLEVDLQCPTSAES